MICKNREAIEVTCYDFFKEGEKIDTKYLASRCNDVSRMDSQKDQLTTRIIDKKTYDEEHKRGAGYRSNEERARVNFHYSTNPFEDYEKGKIVASSLGEIAIEISKITENEKFPVIIPGMIGKVNDYCSRFQAYSATTITRDNNGKVILERNLSLEESVELSRLISRN